MPPEQEPKHEALLVTLQRLLELPTTHVSDTLHQSAQLVATALQAEKVDTFLYDPATESLIAYGTSETPMGAKEKILGLDQLPLAQGGRWKCTRPASPIGAARCSVIRENSPG